MLIIEISSSGPHFRQLVFGCIKNTQRYAQKSSTVCIKTKLSERRLIFPHCSSFAQLSRHISRTQLFSRLSSSLQLFVNVLGFKKAELLLLVNSLDFAEIFAHFPGYPILIYSSLHTRFSQSPWITEIHRICWNVECSGNPAEILHKFCKFRPTFIENLPKSSSTRSYIVY